MLASGHDEPERLVVSGIEDGEGNDTGLAFTAMTGIPQQAMVPETLALGDLARFAQLSFLVEQVIVFWPAQDESGPMQKNLGQPGMAGKAAILQMKHFFTPQLVNMS